ncbi:MAG TPA: dipeptide/oligopeptide/nickel ABC transporter ATP-binding protein [Candidatus Acidoferrum sp.]|jgi:peptide/nickel transport system ATP-binding protein|nr:dipeptide/oligopeptide/nickel ABC transporter ATP-binding protein [Candidatus Acidoferrum sp.]
MTANGNVTIAPLVRVENLVKYYPKKKFVESGEQVRALDGVSFSIFRGTTLAIVGESGSGKSTLALCLACLEAPTSGNIWFEETDFSGLKEKDRRVVRRQIQLIFQDPANSFNPRWSVLEILTEPLRVQGTLGHDEMTSRAGVLLEQVGLPTRLGEKLPSELSGGQRQRLSIARALTLGPRLLILDEALSALDCSVQAQIANLLMDLQASLGTTYLFISHDLAMAGYLADEIAVMSRGQIVEQGAPEGILTQPESRITRELLAAVPRLDFSRSPLAES